MRFIPKMLNYDDHIDSDKPNSISVTTLIGQAYKAQKYLDKTPKTHVLDLVLKRSSFIGTACHNRMEHILEQEEGMVLELFSEREVIVDDVSYVVAGSLDVLAPNEDGTYTIADLKTGYFKSYGEDRLKKDRLQMSIYRWLNQYRYKIADVAYVIALSQSNNFIDEVPLELMSLEETQDYIENKLWSISVNTKVDCRDGIKYSPCSYCQYECTERK